MQPILDTGPTFLHRKLTKFTLCAKLQEIIHTKYVQFLTTTSEKDDFIISGHELCHLYLGHNYKALIV